MKDVALEWIGGLSEEWLIIYDNHPDKGHLTPILPRRNTGNVIYTSRSQGFLADLPADCVYEVNSFSEEDAVELLLKIAGNEEFRTNEKELKALRASVVEVGCLPLAIEAMGSYLRKGDCTPLTYLQIFRDRQNRSELLSKPNADGSSPARPGLYTALDLSYDALLSVRRREGRGVMGTAAQNALAVLNLLCFYHNEEIPVDMIERSAEERLRFGSNVVYPLWKLADDPAMNLSSLLACKYPSKKWDDLHFNLGVQVLQQFSLVKRSRKGDSVSMHVMVQAWAQDKIPKETRKRLAHAARVVLIESIKPGWNRLDQEFLRFLTPHMNACMAHEAECVGYHHQYEAHLDYKLGWYYYQQKQFLHAVDHFERMLRIWKCNAGGYSQTATYGLSLLANVYHDMGRIGDAEAAYVELLTKISMRKEEIVEDYLGREEHTEKDLRKQARRQRVARLLLGRSNDKGVTEDGDQAPGAPDAQASAGKRDNAPPPVIKTLEQLREVVDAVTITEPEKETIWELDLEFGCVYAGLARLLFDSGRHENGKECLKLAIKAAKKDGEEHNFQIWTWEDELIRRSGGADLRYWLKRYKDVNALPPDLHEEFIWHEYGFVLPICLGAAFLGAGDLKGAYTTYEPLLKRAPAMYGPSDRKTLYLLRAMAECSAHRGMFVEANQFARKAVEVAKAAYGQWHFETARSLNTLAVVMVPQTLDLERCSEHWNILKEAYDAVRVAFWEGHPMAKKLKRRLEVFGSIGDDKGEGSSAGEGLLQEVRARILADGTPKSKQDYLDKASIAYREIMRERYQTREKLAKPRLRQQPGADAGLQLTGDTAQGMQNTTIECEEEVTEARRRWKGKGKEIATLSPISKAGSNVREEAAPRPQNGLPRTKRPTDSNRQPNLKR
jgi:tetratricopeptide (TPR) repeat protein